ELTRAGVAQDDPRRKQVLKLFLAGLSIVALLRWLLDLAPWKLALGGALCAAAAFVAHCTCTREPLLADRTSTPGDRATPAASDGRPPRPDAIDGAAPAPGDPSNVASGIAGSDTTHNPTYIYHKPYTVRSDEVKPFVDHLDEPLCALLARLYP